MNAPIRRALLTHTFRQSDFDSFAVLSGDDNPIHVDPQFSANSRFGRTVAHGMLLFTVLRGLMDSLLPGARVVSQDLMFPAPSYADEALLFEVQLIPGEDGGAAADMSVRRASGGEVTCSGRAVLRFARNAA
jgi:acyl dehydratase